MPASQARGERLRPDRWNPSERSSLLRKFPRLLIGGRRNVYDAYFCFISGIKEVGAKQDIPALAAAAEIERQRPRKFWAKRTLRYASGILSQESNAQVYTIEDRLVAKCGNVFKRAGPPNDAVIHPSPRNARCLHPLEATHTPPACGLYREASRRRP